MAEEASHQLARQVVAKLCQALGWHSMQNGACDILADLLRRYVTSLGRSAAGYVANGNQHLFRVNSNTTTDWESVLFYENYKRH